MAYPIRHYSKAQVIRARIAVAEAELGTRPCGKIFWYHTIHVEPLWRKNLTLKCRLGLHLFYGDAK